MLVNKNIDSERWPIERQQELFDKFPAKIYAKYIEPHRGTMNTHSLDMLNIGVNGLETAIKFYVDGKDRYPINVIINNEALCLYNINNATFIDFINTNFPDGQKFIDKYQKLYADL